ncbi:MAG TPA: dephospho-CoA kinase [Anaerolineae bacterium]|nr:dephospho-CoA kinase [Anaerolineae bacterium]
MSDSYAAHNAQYIIGLTGNIATGKSTVAKMLEDLGATVIDADTLVHELQRQGTPVFNDIVAAFGSGILDRDSEIDRKALSSIVFADPEKLRVLESIVHPAVLIESMRRITEAPTPIVVYEAIKLIEAGRAEMCDALWVVTARSDVQLQRLMTDRHMSEAEARQRIEAQPPQSEKIKRATVVIDNSGSREATWQQVEAAYRVIEFQR